MEVVEVVQTGERFGMFGRRGKKEDARGQSEKENERSRPL